MNKICYINSVVFILNFILIRTGILLFIQDRSHAMKSFLWQNTDNIKGLPLPSKSKSWRPFADYIYQHLVGVRLVFISNAGRDPKSTRAVLSHAAPPPTPPSSSSWFPETSGARSQMAPDGEMEINVDHGTKALQLHHRSPWQPC